RYRQRKLDGWRVECWTSRAGLHGKPWQRAGRTKAEFWQCIFDTLAYPGKAWLFCFSPVATMTLLGLWERLDERTLVFPRDGESEEQEGSAAPTRPGASSICCEDNPFIARVKVPGRPGTLQIVGVENYGIRPPASGNGSYCDPEWTGRAVRGIVGC